MQQVTTAVLDACVLYPAPLRDLLLSLAVEVVFHARWTNEIQNEWIRSVLIARPDISEQKLRRTEAIMNQSIDDCLIDGYQTLVGELELPDINDRHVLAAAIAGNADSIVTFNLKDFPEISLSKFKIKAVHPDDFLLDLYMLNQPAVAAAVKSMRSRLINPPKSAAELLEKLEVQGLLKFSCELKKVIGSI